MTATLVLSRGFLAFPKLRETQAARMAVVSLFRTKPSVIRCTHPERSLHGALREILYSPVCVTSGVLRPASANGDGRQSSRRREGSCPQSGRYHSEDFPRARFLPRTECSGAVPQQRRGALC